MKLTCVTAVFNAIKSGNRENLIRCVESVSELKTEHEHLIYDGASTDGTVELLRELEAKTPGLKVVSEPDTGIYNALNKGVRDAAGEWFYVLGCDDYIVFPAVLDSVLENLQPKDEMVVSIVKTNRKIAQCHSWTDCRFMPFEYLYNHQGVLVQTVIMRRFGGFDESYQICADGALWLKLHAACVNIRFTRQTFAYFGSNGVSGDESKYAIHISEKVRFASDFLGISRELAANSKRRGFAPFNRYFKYMFCRDFSLRISAWFQFLNMFKYYVRIVFYPLVVLTRPIRKTWKYEE